MQCTKWTEALPTAAKNSNTFLSGGLNYVNNFENKYLDVFLSGLIGGGFPHSQSNCCAGTGLVAERQWALFVAEYYNQ